MFLVAWSPNPWCCSCFAPRDNVRLRILLLDAMGDKKEKGARAVETDNSPRKAPRLDPGRGDSMEEAVSSDTSSEGCSHFLVNGEEMELLLVKIESLKSGAAPACQYCVLESLRRTAAGAGKEDPHKQQQQQQQQQQLIMVCSQCDQCLCAGVATREDNPWGHAGLHAHKKKHWVALWLDKPQKGYCFFCQEGIYLEGILSVDDESMSSEVEPAGGHARAHASGSDTDERGYVIRGIPNVANTCYLNAMVQCLLVLDKLQMWMLGPDAPTGSIGTALKELFVETRARNDAGVSLNPRKLLESIRALNSQYKGCFMHDSHELLCFLRKCLNEEELKRPPNLQDGASGAVMPTVVDSIFQGQLSTTLTSKCCQSDTVYHASFYELQLPLPSKEHPTKSVASKRRSPAVRQLFPAIEECNLEKVQTIADGCDSHIPGTGLESVEMDIAPEPLEADYSEAEQIHESNDVVHGPLHTHKDVVSCSELSQEIIEVPIKPAVLLPDSVFNVKVEEMYETMVDSHSPEDTGPPPLVSPVRKNNASVASGSDLERKDNAGVAYQPNQPEVDMEAKENTTTVQITREVHTEAKENTCAVQVTTEDKGKALSRDIVYDEKVEDNNSLASIKDCLALFFKDEVVERRCENCSKVPEQPSTTGSKDGGQMVASTDENTSVDRDQNEQKDRSEHADQKVIISKLPPVLTVQLVRFNKDRDNTDEQVKITGHVSFEENLDVGRFTDPSSEDKDNATYGLVGVIEHIGDKVRFGHYVAYVRASRIGSDQQLSSASSSWFRANDDKIREVSLEEVLKCEAYILFYERIEGTVPNSSEQQSLRSR